MTTARTLARTLQDVERRLRDVERSRQMGSSSVETADGDDIPVVAALASGVAAEATVAEVSETVADVQEAVIDIGNVAADAVETADVALASANGKNRVTHSLDAPVDEANVEGDTWFQRDEAGHIVAQYRGLGGTAWAPVTLSHEVIASLDLGKATVGVLTGDRIDANALNGKTITGATVQTAVSGRRWILDSGNVNQLRGYSNAVGEIGPGRLLVDTADSGATGFAEVWSPELKNASNVYGKVAKLRLSAGQPGNALGSRVSTECTYFVPQADSVASVAAGPSGAPKARLLLDALNGAGTASLSGAGMVRIGTTDNGDWPVTVTPGAVVLESPGLGAPAGSVTLNAQGVSLDGPLTAASLRPSEFLYTDNTVGNVTSTAGASAGARGGAGTFVAPPSGVVRIDYGGQTRAPAGEYAGIGIEVRRTSASGAIVKDYSINDAVLNYTTAWSFGMTVTLLTGLIPGATYYVRSMVSTSAGTSNFVRGRFVVTPQP